MTSFGTWDYVVVGGGSAGCVVAARLAQSGARRVLLLEAGEDQRSIAFRVPGAVSELVGNPRCDWEYLSEPDPSRNGRPLRWSAGRVLGGSGAINGLVWNRGLARDYDDWAAQGCAGWSAADLRPVFERIECFADGVAEGRGRDGPMAIEYNRHCSPLLGPFLEACGAAGVPAVADVNAFPDSGVGQVQANTRRGLRCSTRDAYLAVRPRGLTVLTGALATQLEFEGRRCRGVAFLHGGLARTVAATAEVVVCAGTFGSPKLLLRSGLGPPPALQAVGIAPLVALPGVGANLQDHAGAGISLRVAAPTIVDRDRRGLRRLGHGLRWLLRRDGPAAGAAMIACGYARSHVDEAQPDLYLQLAAFGLATDAGGVLRLTEFPAITTFVSVARPRARGRLELVSADPQVPLRGSMALLGDPDDRRRLLDGLRLVRRIHATAALAALKAQECLPGAAEADDEALLRHARARAGSQYHAVGSCRMGIDDHAVVDPMLRVRGVGGLRVADASIMPRITSGNTHAPTVMIGERAAALILSGAGAAPGPPVLR